jgi:DNA-binding response OmpR family regulator
MIPNGGLVPSVCLAGPVITNNRALVDALKARHEVTLVTDNTRLQGSQILALSDVLVLDASGSGGALRPLLRSLRQSLPELPIVLVDGGLTEHEKAEAFNLGVLDYFPAPCHIRLLAERLEVLARVRVPRPA